MKLKKMDFRALQTCFSTSSNLIILALSSASGTINILSGQ